MTATDSALTPTFSSRKFSEFDLHPKLKQSLDEAGFVQLTPIQALSLPHALAGRDVAGQAQTGTGKTGAFLIAAFQRLLNSNDEERLADPNPKAVILAPTRELAIQIHKDAEALGKHTNLRLALAYGGIDYEKQRRSLADGCDILIGTPGRIIDYFKQRVFHFKHTDVVVLDEADRMFDLGFIKDIRFLLRRMPHPEKRLNMLFSATLSYRVTELAYEHMNDPERVEAETESVTADRVEQKVYFPANNEKLGLLIGLLKKIDPKRTMIFSNTKAGVDLVARYLEGNGFNAAVLSGDVRQKKRQSLLAKFHAGELDILVATDVAARGLHIPDVSHVFNYDLPQDPEDYVHRVGRTARLGTTGDAISFACEDSAFYLPEIEALIEQSIAVESVSQDMLAELQPPAHAKRKPGRGGKPKRGKGSGRPQGSKHQNAQADGEGAAKKKRRRRRRRKPSGGDASGSNNQSSNGGEN